MGDAMQQKYRNWIESNYPTWGTARGKCHQACLDIQKIFPELTITNGFVWALGYPTEQEHWWLKDTEGNIVDPTKIQFGGILNYEEVDDSHPLRNYPREKCCNCGEKYYRTPDHQYSSVCSKDCGDAYLAYLNKPYRSDYDNSY